MRSKSGAIGSLSLTERSVLKLLDEHKQLLPSELAVIEKITTQSMSQILNHLTELDLIIRTPSETDKRKVLITMSAAGLELLYKTRHERDEWLAKALQETCTDTELEVLIKAVGPLSRVVNFE
ncbi:MarR family winged helix-turn-helix transcriptional regulator [Mucilaginibacter ginkgonis]|uniref:MarR family transcriptional regulator n=1 Tax=Mucilaginibacter ginkgonis TaxID=2682091 RepID=A0A7T7F8N8_9SPHI|nr:MarR family transcriptional regulator [Mucilaginibacter ginkgonis]QQL48842.1 MarR family transcriptional regulator [Mucilaginibacter ginkgonis]